MIRRENEIFAAMSINVTVTIRTRTVRNWTENKECK